MRMSQHTIVGNLTLCQSMCEAYQDCVYHRHVKPKFGPL